MSAFQMKRLLQKGRWFWLGGISATVALAIVILALSGRSGSDDVRHEGEGWSSISVGDLNKHDLMFITYSPEFIVRNDGGIELLESETPQIIEVVDRDTENRLASISVGRDPLVAYAQMNGWLLVSVLPELGQIAQSGHIYHRLLIFDIEHNLRLLSDIKIEGQRLRGFTPPLLFENGTLTLSNDESHLYYIENTGSIGRINLENTPQILPPVQLPATATCDNTSLYPSGSSSVIIRCASFERPWRPGTIRILSPDGTLGPELVTQEPGDPEEMLANPPIPIYTAIETPDGFGFIFADGSYGVPEDLEVKVVGRALPPEKGAYTWYSDSLKLDSTRLVIPYWSSFPQSAPPSLAEGFVVFNTESQTIEQDVQTPVYGTYPLDSEKIAIVKQGSIDIFDVSSGEIERTIRTSDEALVRVR